MLGAGVMVAAGAVVAPLPGADVPCAETERTRDRNRRGWTNAMDEVVDKSR